MLIPAPVLSKHESLGFHHSSKGHKLTQLPKKSEYKSLPPTVILCTMLKCWNIEAKKCLILQTQIQRATFNCRVKYILQGFLSTWTKQDINGQRVDQMLLQHISPFCPNLLTGWFWASSSAFHSTCRPGLSWVNKQRCWAITTEFTP